jgi:hypothetical protein
LFLPSLLLPIHTFRKVVRVLSFSCSIVVRRLDVASADSYNAVDGPSGCARSCH